MIIVQRILAELFYNILILALGIYGILSGFRHGLSGQVCSVLGFAFGAVSAHAFGEPCEEMLRSWCPSIAHVVGGQFIYSVMAAAVIYIAVYYLFTLLTGALRGALQTFQVGMLDSLFGAAFGCMKFLIGLSLFFNIIVCIDPDSVLLKSSTASDGNLIEGVMALAPMMLGSLDYDDYSHIIQLHEARKISQGVFLRPIKTIEYPQMLITIEPAFIHDAGLCKRYA